MDVTSKYLKIYHNESLDVRCLMNETYESVIVIIDECFDQLEKVSNVTVSAIDASCKAINQR